MSDLIDRQALLRQIDIDSDGEPGYYGDTWKFIDTIKRMPSAHGTNLAEVGMDCISREQAIDAECEVCQIAPKKERGHNCTYYVHGCKEIECLRALPSAQPKRDKGKWIDETFKPWGLVYHPYKCDQCGEHSEADSNFCPNCGADMRGEKHG